MSKSRRTVWCEGMTNPRGSRYVRSLFMPGFSPMEYARSSSTIPLTKYSRNVFLVTCFSGFSAPRAVKAPIKLRCAPIPDFACSLVWTTSDPPAISLPSLASYNAHVCDPGIRLQAMECDMKLLEAGCFKVSKLYLVQPAVRGDVRNLLQCITGELSSFESPQQVHEPAMIASPFPDRRVLAKSSLRCPLCKCPSCFFGISSCLSFNIFNLGIF
jgi:hypothetical protein